MSKPEESEEYKAYDWLSEHYNGNWEMWIDPLSIKARIEELADALKALANEASAFLSMADPETHGYTNTAILRQRISVARTVITKAEGESK